MTIDICVKLLRTGNVYIAGEAVQCDVTFTNTSVPSSLKALASDEKLRCFSDQELTDDVEYLAWASCQLHCQQVFNERYVRSIAVGDSPLHNDIGSTALGTSRAEAGQCLYSSKPAILVCDLHLAPGESCSCHYSETLPPDDLVLAPSFRGQAVKYLYKLTVAAQRVGTTIKLLRVPLRVLIVPGLATATFDELEYRPSNPFLPKEPKHSMLDRGNEVIETLTCGKSPHVYNVIHEAGLVAKFTLFKTCYKLGDEVVGYFDFRGTKIACLQSDECVSDELRVKGHHTKLHTTHAREHIVCIGRSDAHISLGIPVDATPTFFTDAVTHKWRLHFDFTLTTHADAVAGVTMTASDGSQFWRPPTDITAQNLVWDLPIKVYPCSPLNAALGLAAEGQVHELVI